MDEYKSFKSYDLPGQSEFNPDGGSGGDYPHPAIIDTFEGEEDRMLVRPGSDIFCLNGRLESLFQTRHMRVIPPAALYQA